MSTVAAKVFENATAAPVTGELKQQRRCPKTVQLTVEGTGAVAAKASVYGSNDGNGVVFLGSIVLNGTTKVSDGFVITAPWNQLRMDLDSISGTSAKATGTICE